PPRAGIADRGDEFAEIATPEQMARNSRRDGGGEVAVLVPDKKACLPVDRPVPHQVEDHAGRRLAPVADLAIGRYRPFRVKGAIAEIVDMSADRRELGRHMRVDG